MKVHEVLALLKADGWYLPRIRGSHRQYRHPQKGGTVTVAGRLRLDVPRGSLKSTLEQAGLR